MGSTETFSASDVIGKNLVASKNVIAHNGNPDSTDTFTILAGQNAGTVYSWVNNAAGQLCWEFVGTDYLGNQTDYYIVHTSDSFTITSLTNAGVESDDQKAADAADAKKKEDEGAFVYYLEKFGEPVLKYGLLAYVGTKVVTAIIDRPSKN